MRSDCDTPIYWHNCYSGGFDLIAPDSFAHPAKMAPALCYRILKHLEELGMLKENDTILDPMGGTGLTAICANAMNYKAVTVELEEKFIGFQKQNKEYAERRLYRPLDWQIIQGDSRKLSELLGGNGLKAVTSPPYNDMMNSEKHGLDLTKKARDGDITHQPSADLHLSHRNYGQTPGQIGNMKDLPLKAVMSPPYQDSRVGQEAGKGKEITDKRAERLKAAGYDPERILTPGRRAHGNLGELEHYSDNPDNIGNLPDKPLKSVMSPPYEKAQSGGGIAKKGYINQYSHAGNPDTVGNRTYMPETAGQSIGQVSAESGETYLSAMQQVYTEIAKVSDVLVVVVKNPTRNKQLHRLDLDTIKILEVSGWSIHCQHRALLFAELIQADLFQGTLRKVKGRMSFFKRLSWQNGQPVASWEDVIVAVRKGVL